MAAAKMMGISKGALHSSKIKDRIAVDVIVGEYNNSSMVEKIEEVAVDEAIWLKPENWVFVINSLQPNWAEVNAVKYLKGIFPAITVVQFYENLDSENVYLSAMELVGNRQILDEERMIRTGHIDYDIIEKTMDPEYMPKISEIYKLKAKIATCIMKTRINSVMENSDMKEIILILSHY